MNKILKLDFFESKNTAQVSKDLLGKFLIRKIGRESKAYMITEVEAYCGPKDKASHAHKGKTKRNEPMFGVAGHWYVYLVYGMHYMLNIVTGPDNYPAAILIRGLEGIGGPGRVAKKLQINKSFNNKEAVPENSLWIEDRSVKINKKDIKKSARIGVDYAGPVWAKKNLRFFICHSALDAESRNKN